LRPKPPIVEGGFEPVCKVPLFEAEDICVELEQAGIPAKWVETPVDSLGASIGYVEMEPTATICVAWVHKERAEELIERRGDEAR
jgi:hypothetical protein